MQTYITQNVATADIYYTITKKKKLCCLTLSMPMQKYKYT